MYTMEWMLGKKEGKKHVFKTCARSWETTKSKKIGSKTYNFVFGEQTVKTIFTTVDRQ